MLYGLDIGLTIFVVLCVFTMLYFVVAFKRLKAYIIKKEKPKLTLIQGGKKEGESHD